MVEGMSVVVNVMLSLMSVMSQPPYYSCKIKFFTAHKLRERPYGEYQTIDNCTNMSPVQHI